MLCSHINTLYLIFSHESNSRITNVRPSVCPSVRLKSIAKNDLFNCIWYLIWAYWPSGLSTIEPINLWSSSSYQFWVSYVQAILRIPGPGSNRMRWRDWWWFWWWQRNSLQCNVDVCPSLADQRCCHWRVHRQTDNTTHGLDLRFGHRAMLTKHLRCNY